MTKAELNKQFEILKTDVSGLVNTSQISRPGVYSILDNRIEKGEDGEYTLLPLPQVTSREDRVRVILGAIIPTKDARTVMSLHSNLFTGKVDDKVLVLKPLLEKIDNQCITLDRLVYNVLLLLRFEGILDFGKTPLCGDRNPDEFLRSLISESGLAYSDTLLALLDCVQGDSPKDKASAFFITEDPDEKPGGKLDRAVMLLSLLSADDIHEFGRDRVSYWFGSISTFFGDSLQKVAPFFMLGCPKLKDLFKVSKIARNKEDEKAPFWADKLSEFRDQCWGWSEGPIAVSGTLYKETLLLCANAGVSCSSWLYNADELEKAAAAGVTKWLLEKYDDKMADLIMNKEGYYLLANEAGRLSSSSFYELRKYIVDNGYLLDVWYNSVEMDRDRQFEYFEIDTNKSFEQTEYVRFFNFCNNGLNKEYASLIDVFRLEESSKENRIYRFVSKEEIVDNDYNLNMNLYNSYDYATCNHPVQLSEILTPIVGDHVKIDQDYYDDKVITATFSDNPLENYAEPSKAGLSWMNTGDCLYAVKSALILKNTWPMSPRWVPADPSLSDEKEYLGIIMRNGEHSIGFSVDTSVANPWYIAFRLSQASWQFRDRANQDGTIETKNLLKMYVDLPSLSEQKKEVEEVIIKELERKKAQVGAADTLFNLAHTIGLPANRIQSILGNLKDVCRDMPEVFSDLKKVGDNFDYILRVINSTSKDFSGNKDPLKEQKILPILERFVSAFSSLPFGLDPVIERRAVPADAKLNVNETLLSIMFDNILRNAHRHGFNKIVSKDHKVLILLSLTRFEEQNYYMMSFCNNGNKLEKDFSIFDFISRGKKGKTSGNTGQGGYDIYQIIRKFGGKLGLRSSEEWNFILDVLIPISEIDEHATIPVYSYGALV